MDRMIIEDIRDYVFPIQLGLYPVNPASDMFVIDKDSFLGTAFFITRNGVALTAAHCMPSPEVLGEKILCAGLWDGSQIRAHRVLASAQFGNLDIAVIKVENIKSKFLPLSFESVPMAEDVWTVGLPAHLLWNQGLEVRALKGHVTRSGHFLELSFAVPAGMSGSPVLSGTKAIGVLQGNCKAETLEDRIEETVQQAPGRELRKIQEVRAVINYGLATPLLPMRMVKHEIFGEVTFEDFVRRMTQKV